MKVTSTDSNSQLSSSISSAFFLSHRPICSKFDTQEGDRNRADMLHIADRLHNRRGAEAPEGAQPVCKAASLNHIRYVIERSFTRFGTVDGGQRVKGLFGCHFVTAAV